MFESGISPLCLQISFCINIILGTDANEDQIGRFFQTLYDGLSKDQQAWMPYEDPESRFPLTFHPLDDTLNKDNDVMMVVGHS